MYPGSENVQGNHVAINDCDQVFRLREPRGDRACIWESEDGTDHALVGLDHEDLIVEAKHCEDGSYWAALRRGEVVILRQNDSLIIDHVQQEVLETPLGVLVYSRYGRFSWVLQGSIWEGSLKTNSIDWVHNPNFDSDTGDVVGELSLAPSGVQLYRLNPNERTITYGPIEGVREPVNPIHLLGTLGQGVWRQVIERIRK
ncbi:MAG: hypothetical protein QE269_07155 [Fimbriimonas sp.]|nr:hypothetical protein [Fimbriimonas sp.]